MQQVAVTDSRLSPDEMILDHVDVSEKPLYTVSEVAKVFFGKSPHWIRWRERSDFFVLDGEQIATTRSESGSRKYSLSDVEKMSHALAERGAIDGAQLTNALLMVQTNAKIWGYIE